MKRRTFVHRIGLTAALGVLSCGVGMAQTQLLGHFSGCGGFSLVAFDDWDGDGVADIVRSCGGAQVVLTSGATGATLATIQPLNSYSAVVHVYGTIADLDQDGHPEVIIGEPTGLVGPGFPSALGYVAACSFATPWTPLWVHSPPAFCCAPYRAFAVVGDVDGDGIQEVAAGFPGGGPDCVNYQSIPPPLQYPGLLEILSGATGAVLQSQPSALGEAWPAGAVAPQDLNGDGVPDYVVVGSGRPPPAVATCPLGLLPLPAYPSRLSAFSGATGALLWQITGPPAQDSFLTSIGDVDGDQDVDLLVRGTLLPGPMGFEAIVDAGTGTILTSSQPSAGPGFLTGAPVGDVNGDGAGDFVTGIPAGAAVRTGLGGAVLYVLTGLTALPVPMSDLDGDGRTDYGFSSFLSGPNPPGFADWFILSLGTTATQASASGFGVGCGGGGSVPGLVVSGPPYFGWTRTMGYVNGPPGGVGNILLGIPGPPTPISGSCVVYLDLSQPISLLWSLALDASGSATTSIVMPPVPGLAGTTARMQGVHGAPGGAAVTAAIDLVFGF